jgi:hypothetical protein
MIPICPGSEVEGGVGSPAPLDPDERVLICRVCGESFVARVGWRPICRDCWRVSPARDGQP